MSIVKDNEIDFSDSNSPLIMIHVSSVIRNNPGIRNLRMTRPQKENWNQAMNDRVNKGKGMEEFNIITQ